MELWDVRDEAGNCLGKTIARGQPFQPGEYHLMVEVWLIDHEGNYLIQKRASNKKVLPNMWSLTTGCMQAGEDSRTGCVREVREELGISLCAERLVAVGRLVHQPGIWDIYAARVEASLPPLRLQASEVSDARWFSQQEFQALMQRNDFYCYPGIERTFQKVQRLLPAVR